MNAHLNLQRPPNSSSPKLLSSNISPPMSDDCDRGLTSSSSSLTAIGLWLLPSDLLQEIFFRLALPELLRLRSVSRGLGVLVSADDFRRLYDLRSGRGGGWLFVYKKRPPRDSVLRGFNDHSGSWFQIPLAGILKPAVSPEETEDLYFLAVSGRFFLFASNVRRDLVAVNLATRAVRRIPPSPLGPRGTSSWRRSGLKLVADPSGSNHFRFLFAELHHNRPVLFEYSSETDMWRAIEAQAGQSGPPRADNDGRICLMVHLGAETLVLSCAAAGGGGPGQVSAHRPRFPEGFDGGSLLGFATSDRFHVYGDGNVAVVRSTAADEGPRVRSRVITGVELLGMSGDGRQWELTSRAPEEVVERVRKPYGAMMGCVVERDGVVRIVLMSNCKGSWDLVWLAYDRVQRRWTWVPVPDCWTKGLNMAGLAVSSTFSRLWPTSAQ